MFQIKINTDNAAFQPDASLEVISILEHVVRQLDAGQTGGNVRDSNGNTVGEWKLNNK